MLPIHPFSNDQKASCIKHASTSLGRTRDRKSLLWLFFFYPLILIRHFTLFILFRIGALVLSLSFIKSLEMMILRK